MKQRIQSARRLRILGGLVEGLRSPALFYTEPLGAKLGLDAVLVRQELSVLMREFEIPKGPAVQRRRWLAEKVQALDVLSAAGTQSIVRLAEPRPLQALRLVAAGKTNEEIAAALNVSYQYVGQLVAKLYRRFDLTNRRRSSSAKRMLLIERARAAGLLGEEVRRAA